MSSEVISSLSTITPTTVTGSRSAGAASNVAAPLSSVSMMPTSNDEPTPIPAASAKLWLIITSCGLSGSSNGPNVSSSRSISR